MLEPSPNSGGAGIRAWKRRCCRPSRDRRAAQLRQFVDTSKQSANSLGTIIWQMLTLAYCRGEPARIQLAQRLLIRDQAGARRFDRGEKLRAPAIGPTVARGAYV